MLAIATFVLLGLHPLLALWIGIAVVGASMLSTPSEPLNPRYLVLMLNNTLANIAMILESLGIKSKATYVAYEGKVYILVSREGFVRLPAAPPREFIMNINGSSVLVLRSPIDREIVENLENVCTAVDQVVVDLLDIADSTACVEEGDVITLEISKPKLSNPGKLEQVVGSIYGIVAASITALLKGKPCTILADQSIGRDKRRIVLKVLHYE